MHGSHPSVKKGTRMHKIILPSGDEIDATFVRADEESWAQGLKGYIATMDHFTYTLNGETFAIAASAVSIRV